MGQFLVIWGGTLLFSFIPGYFLKPRATFKAHTWASLTIHILTVSICFFTVVLITHRPYFAMLVTLGALGIFVIVSNAKYKTLREPLVFSDIAMFAQAFRHPRLYLPFLGIVPAIGAPLIAVTFIVLLMRFEAFIPVSLWTQCLIVLSIVISIFMVKSLALSLELTQNPGSDIKRYGLMASLLGYACQAKSTKHKKQIDNVLLSSPLHLYAQNGGNTTKPHIVVIQSESFFDARRLHPSIEPSLLKNFDQLCTESLLSGRLKVPAWGANTMRTEFSFLTGIRSEDLSLYQFYPYHYLKGQFIQSLASHYSQNGYYCVCVHPHESSFFGRDKMFPNMGFDEFVDIRSFDRQQTFGPYISDEAVTKKILHMLANKQDKPLFIFVITMENHGPLHLEKTTSSDIKNLYRGQPPQASSDLTVYLRHLKNADKMFGDLRDVLVQSEDETVLCVYGDHIPSMPEIYQAVSYEDEQTEYFIWNNRKLQKSGVVEGLSVEQLTLRLLSLSKSLKITA